MTERTPTPEQREIISAVLRGESIMVEALAGAAKSTTIEMAAAALSSQWSMREMEAHSGNAVWTRPPALALAFNKKIAQELGPRLPFPVKTLNALGHAAWKDRVGRVDLDGEKMAKLRKELDPSAPWQFSKLVSMAKLQGLVPKEYAGQGTGMLADEPQAWEDIADDLDINLQVEDPKSGLLTDYLPFCRQLLCRSIKRAFEGLIDFDDQVYMPTCFGGMWTKPQILFVDEAQDLSPLNHLMLRRLAPKQLVVVGDPLQSIYAFRGADTESMPKLREDWDLKTYKLSVCFRCSRAVAKAAKRWAPHIQSPEWAEEGEVWREGFQGEDKTRDFHNLPERLAILCRNNAPVIKLALKVFRKRKVAFINSRLATQMLSQLRQIVAYKKDLDIETVASKIATWRNKRLETEEPKKHERIIDQAEALIYCAEVARNYSDLEKVISDLFQAKDADLVFGTGHGAKGLEWDYVLHLDSWRLPSKYAVSEGARQQEENLAYVITTRARKELYFANLDEFEERR